jgi:hypothetical protein
MFSAMADNTIGSTHISSGVCRRLQGQVVEIGLKQGEKVGRLMIDRDGNRVAGIAQDDGVEMDETVGRRADDLFDLELILIGSHDFAVGSSSYCLVPGGKASDLSQRRAFAGETLNGGVSR